MTGIAPQTLVYLVYLVYRIDFVQPKRDEPNKTNTVFVLVLRLLCCWRCGSTGEFLLEKFSSEDRNPQCETERDRNK